MNSSQILKRLYPQAVKVKRPCRTLRVARRFSRWARKNALPLGLGGGLIMLWIAGHLYYYNKLIDLEFNVQASWAQVETQWQRRYHIQQNVTQLVGEYARHEQQLMLKLTELRAQAVEATAATQQDKSASAAGGPAGNAGQPVAAGQPGAAGNSGATGAEAAPAASAAKAGGQLSQLLDEITPQQLNKLFPQIRLEAEQYPQLRASENFQQFSEAIIDTETKIAEQVMAYNTAVNVYTTVLQQFPANVFGRLCGFELYQFYSPERESLPFHKLSYSQQGSVPAAPGAR